MLKIATNDHSVNEKDYDVYDGAYNTANCNEVEEYYTGMLVSARSIDTEVCELFHAGKSVV